MPKKVLLRIGTKTILERCHQRVSLAQGVSKIVVSTSDEVDDKQIVNYCKDKNWHVSTGSLNDVGLRLLQIAKTEKKSSFVRISADSPFIDPKIIDTAISLSKSKKFDLVSNVFPRSFPKGQSVEIIRTEALDRICKNNRSKEQKEHMTKYFYENFEKFKIISFESGEDFTNSNQSIDDKPDLTWAKTIAEKIDDCKSTWQEIESISYKNKFSGSDE